MDTRSQVIVTASSLCQSVGINGFSFRDISEKLGIKTSSIHYYFPTKDDLTLALISSYREELKNFLEQLEIREISPLKRLFGFINLLEEYLPEKTCLCGMLAAEVNAVNDEVRVAIKSFLSDLELWIQKTLTQAKKDKEISVNPQTASKFIASSLQGLLLCSRAFQDKTRFKEGVKCIEIFLKGVF
jgi:TetR/AcrR family transcriptional repressor of nem operon